MYSIGADLLGSRLPCCPPYKVTRDHNSAGFNTLPDLRTRPLLFTDRAPEERLLFEPGSGSLVTVLYVALGLSTEN